MPRGRGIFEKPKEKYLTRSQMIKDSLSSKQETTPQTGYTHRDFLNGGTTQTGFAHRDLLEEITPTTKKTTPQTGYSQVRDYFKQEKTTQPTATRQPSTPQQTVDYGRLESQAKEMAKQERMRQQAGLESQLSLLDILSSQALGLAETGAIGMGLGLEEAQQKYGISGGLALAEQSNLQAQFAQQLGSIYGEKAIQEAELRGQIGGLEGMEDLSYLGYYSDLLNLEGQEKGLEAMGLDIGTQQLQQLLLGQQIAGAKESVKGQQLQNLLAKRTYDFGGMSQEDQLRYLASLPQQY